jgi:acetylornithine deacetylase/succinyl-diaminopimelate desuccinylase-like protein
LPEAALLEAARRYEADLVELLRWLVRAPSVNGRDTEAAAALLLVETGRRLGFDASLIAADPARPNALVSWGSGPAGFALIGHLDTVAEGSAAAWTSPPFAAEMRDGRLYGRGAADNKAGLACALYTLALLRDERLLNPDAAQVVLAGVVDEESGASSMLGVRHLLDTDCLPVQGAIYTYTSDIVCVGHRGLLRLVLEAQGQAVHTGSESWARGEGGVNAVTGLAEVLLRIEALRVAAPVHPAFQGLGCTITPGTVIRGGAFESIVPDTAEAVIDARLVPGQDADALIAAVQEAIAGVEAARPGFSVDLRVKNNLPGAAIPMDHPLALIARRHAEAATGRAWPIRGAGPANEGYMLIGAGIPTLCGFGPMGGNAHAPDEWVEVASLAQTVAIYAATIVEYLGAG